MLRKLRTSLKSIIVKDSAPVDATAATRFVQHAVNSDMSEVRDMLEENPEFLMQTATVFDHLGNKLVDHTGYQAALAVGNLGVAKMMREYFHKLRNVNGEAERLRQFSQQFSRGINAEEFETPYDFSPLVDAISNSSYGDITAALRFEVDANNPSKFSVAIDKFRHDFLPRDITAGKIDNLHHLKDACDIFDANKNKWNWHQCALFWRQVIGYLQLNAAMCDARVLRSGLTAVIEKHESVNGPSLMINFRGVEYHYYLDSDVDNKKGLGFEFALDANGQARDYLLPGEESCGEFSMGEYIQKLSAAKAARYIELMQPFHKPIYAGNTLFYGIQKSMAKSHLETAHQCMEYTAVCECADYLGLAEKYLNLYIKNVTSLRDQKEFRFARQPEKLAQARTEFAEAMQEADKLKLIIEKLERDYGKPVEPLSVSVLDMGGS